ncbi:MAG: hypothetical protein KDA60_21655, partial [Planctomycetales bacterium]|nr:hypothetical protein [Planctomycetales bacterium]
MKQALNHRCPRRRFACESLESRQMMDASMLR